MKVSDALQGVSRLFLDTAPVIYYLEKNPTYSGIVDEIFADIDRGAITAVTSPITLAECLVHPFQGGNTTLAQLYQDFIVDGKNTTFVPISDATAALAAEVRAQHNITLADAFQVSVAIEDGCDAFLTNDNALTRITRISVILLDDLET